jgi:putative methyltransferase (TIGR04325 family)
VDWLEDHLPLLRKWHRFEYDQHFDQVSKWDRIFSGVYPSFEAAEKAIPLRKPVGFDNPQTATFLGLKTKLLPSDYPVMYWLRELIGPTTRIFDFGGYSGVSYRAYAPYLHYPDAMEWTVYDVPAVIAAGKKHQCEMPAAEKHLRFTDTIEDGSDSDVFLASGSLHYCEKNLSDFLRALAVRPRYLLLNKLPLILGPSFVTLQNMGPAISPYRVFNVDEFHREVESLGYRIVDRWSNPDVACYIPFHPENTVKEFTGMLLSSEEK